MTVNDGGVVSFIGATSCFDTTLESITDVPWEFFAFTLKKCVFEYDNPEITSLVWVSTASGYWVYVVPSVDW